MIRSMDWDGKRVPRLGFGCGSVMGRVGRKASLRAMGEAWEAGVRIFDTARSYGYGEAEGLLGEFLRRRRDEAVVVTKFGIWPRSQPAWKRLAKPVVRAGLKMLPGARGMVRQAVAGDAAAGRFDVGTMRASLERSLRELRTECVDALLAHEAPASVMGQEDLMAAMEAVVREGKARRVGLSCTQEVAAMQGPGALSVVQFPANLFEDGVGSWPADGRLRMVNHPFGGEVRVRAAVAVIEAMRREVRVDAALREKLQGDARVRLAEVVFGAVMQGADCVVPSMLHLENLRANVVAMGSDRFSVAEVEVVRGWVRSGRSDKG